MSYRCSECHIVITATRMMRHTEYRQITDATTGRPRKEIRQERPICPTCHSMKTMGTGNYTNHLDRTDMQEGREDG